MGRDEPRAEHRREADAAAGEHSDGLARADVRPARDRGDPGHHAAAEQAGERRVERSTEPGWRRSPARRRASRRRRRARGDARPSPSRERRVVPSRQDTVVHAARRFQAEVTRPCRQKRQRPQAGVNVRTTCSPIRPGRRLRRPSSITPAPSCPSTIGSGAGHLPSSSERSLRQMPDARSRTSTSSRAGGCELELVDSRARTRSRSRQGGG